MLIVDDYPSLAEIVDRRLRVAGFHTRLCAGGAEAIRILREERFDIVVLDVMMPEIDGFEVMRFIREEHIVPDLPVVLLTACSSDDDIAKAMALGADGYVTKPFNAVELVRTVQLLLEERRAA